MFRVGLNPYGLSYTVGLQGTGTPRANPHPIGMEGFVAMARDVGARCIELDWRWLTPMTDADLRRLGERLSDVTTICSHWLTQQPEETLEEAIRCATAIGAPVVRLHLTPILEGARARAGSRWPHMIEHARATLKREAVKAADAGLILAVENHQDLCSEELVAIAEEAGENVGVTLDTGNPFAVGEDPLAFVRRAAHRIRHVHLKDYVVQFTAEGYRLVRCAIGDGCVPFADISTLLAARSPGLTASLEPGALEARHIRVFAADWWDGYPPRTASELGTALGRLQRNRLNDDEDCGTPWERQAPGSELIEYEKGQMRRSVDNMRAMGWL